MKFIFSLVFVSAIFLVSCNTKNAVEYNNKIVGIESRLAVQMDITENNIGKYFDSSNYDSIAIEAGKMETLVDQALDEIKKSPAPQIKEGENFKNASITYFQFIKNIYTAYKNIGLEKTDEGRQTAYADLMKLVDKKQAVLDDMQAAQKKYATANGFTVK